jgi:peptidoglycan/LPS O-acetylase OafA/YrhL
MRKLVRPSETVGHERNNLNAIRLAMALLVVWSHSFAIHLGSERTEWVSLLLSGVFNAGNVAVMAFFIVSGFLIAQSFERSSSVKSYMLKRVRRIYPGYMVATTISGFVFVWLIAPTPPFAFAKAFAMNLLLRNYAPSGSHDLLQINGALWSIPFEFWCYIGVVGLGVYGRKRWVVFPLLLSIVALHVGLDILGKKPGLGVVGTIFGWPYLWTRMAPCFLLGMGAYAFREELPRSRFLLIGLFVATVLSCALNADLGFVVALPSLAYAIFYVAFSELPFHNFARSVGGDYSYGVYLYGYLIQKSLQLTIARTWSLAEFMAASFVLAVVAGIASWWLVERRFMVVTRRTSDLGSPSNSFAPR